MKEYIKNNLKEKRPDLLKEWDYEKNVGLSPESIGSRSNKKVWWKCSRGHSWQQSPDGRAESNCPYCSGKKVLAGYNDLLSQMPEVAIDWDYERNTSFGPDEIRPGSNKKVWWKCHICGHSWNVSPNSRTRKDDLRKCPKCANKDGAYKRRVNLIQKDGTSLKSLRPDLIKEWAFDLNSDIDLDTVSIKSTKVVWWKCKLCSYEWKMQVAHRVKNNGSCPKCKGTLLQVGINDLATLMPKLADEWNYNKNGVLKPYQVKLGSNKKVWWICKRGHEWQAVINARTNGTGCPECSKFFSTSFPEQSILYYLSKNFKTNNRAKIGKWEIDIFLPEYNIAIEYDGLLYHSDKSSQKRDARKDADLLKEGIRLFRMKETKNNQDDTDQIIYIVPKGNYYTLDDALRRLFQLINKKTGIIVNVDVDIARDKRDILSNYRNIPPENNLVSENADIVSEWDYEKNGKNGPEFFTKYSAAKVWWKCNKGHSYICAVNNKVVGGTKCPICSNRQTLKGFNDIATTNPELLLEWDYEKNTDISPEKANAKTSRKIWWKCNKGHSWQSGINVRTNGYGCPYCSGRYVIKGQNDLASTHSELLKEWDYGKNNKITPESVMAGSPKKVWWKCNKGHSWRTSVNIRALSNSKCPYCTNQKILVGYNDLETVNPKLAAEWCYEKNGNLTPKSVHAGSSKKVWWKCSNDHLWHAKVADRNRGSGCPYCYNRLVIKGVNDLSSVFPDMAKEWNYEKNINMKPDMFHAGSNKRVWWKCINGHEWFVSPNSRIKKNRTISKCPYCLGRNAVRGVNDFESNWPELLKEWDIERNIIKPSEVTQFSSKRVFWKCQKCNASWISTVAGRTSAGNGCPVCSKANRGKNRRKKVLKVETGEIYVSVKEAAEKNNVCRDIISNCCNGKREKAAGFSWKYID